MSAHSQVKHAKLAGQRKRRKATKCWDCKKYEKTPNGFLMRAYRNMLSRTLGLVKPHLYKGLSILPKEEFYAWSRANLDFWRLYRVWVAAEYARKLSPSINRIDTKKGYEIGNIEWITHSANSALGGSYSKKRAAVLRVLGHG